MSDITLLEIVEAIEGPIERHVDAAQFNLPRSDRRAFTRVLYEVADDTAKRLAAVTLADLKLANAA